MYRPVTSNEIESVMKNRNLPKSKNPGSDRIYLHQTFREVQFSSVTQLSLTLCDPMDCSIPGLPVHHQLSEPTQTHVHCVSDAIPLIRIYGMTL